MNVSCELPPQPDTAVKFDSDSHTCAAEDSSPAAEETAGRPRGRAAARRRVVVSDSDDSDTADNANPSDDDYTVPADDYEPSEDGNDASNTSSDDEYDPVAPTPADTSECSGRVAHTSGSRVLIAMM